MTNNLTILPNQNMNFTPPKIGVVDAPQMSKTPITDTLTKREEDRKSEPAPKIKKKKNALLRTIDVLQAAVSLIAVGFIGKALKQTIKKIK